MIVVEGPDGAGKTTLIAKLVEELDLKVAPRVVTKDAEAMVNLRDWVEANLGAGFQDQIFDRHRLISEPIYGPILRDHFERGFDDVFWFSQQLRRFYNLRPVLIYCLPPLKQVWKNVMSDDDNKIFHGNGKALQQVWGAYFNKMCTDRVKLHDVHYYDYTAPNAYMVESLIINRTRAILKDRGFNVPEA